jgi:hypothetical protein
MSSHNDERGVIMQTLTKHNVLMALQIEDSKSHSSQEGIPVADDEELQKIRARG